MTGSELGFLILGLFVGCFLCTVWGMFEENNARRDREEREGWF